MRQIDVHGETARPLPAVRPLPPAQRCAALGALMVLLGAIGQATGAWTSVPFGLLIPMIAAVPVLAAVWVRGGRRSTRGRNARVLDHAILSTGWFIGLDGLAGDVGRPWADGTAAVLGAVMASLLLTSAVHSIGRGLARKAVRYSLGAAEIVLAATLLGAVAERNDVGVPAVFGWAVVVAVLLVAVLMPDDEDVVRGPGSSVGLVSTVGVAVAVLGLAVVNVVDGYGQGVEGAAIGALIALGVVRWAVAVVQAEWLTGSLRVEQRQARYLAGHDALTGLPNRRCWDEALAQRDGVGASHAILLADLDDLAAVNDSFGTAVGDEVLRVVAARIATCLPPGDLLARVDGDEFAILTSDSGLAHGLAERIRARVCAPVTIAENQVNPRLTVGVCDQPGPVSEETMRRADAALATAKRQRRGSYVIWDAGVRSSGLQEMQLRNDLVGALRDGDIHTAYQPVYAVSGRLDGFEALARWSRHGNAVPPDTFLLRAQALGLMPELDQLMLRRAIATAAGWRVGGRTLSMGVNLGQATLADPDLPEIVAALLAAAQLPADALIIELPETQYVENDPACVATMDRLRSQGVRFALDDFGVGYSSLSRLRRFPTDVVKIDREFITPLEQEPADATLVRWVCELAHASGATVVAEGVETNRQLALVREAGVDALQGYLMGRPGDRDQADATVLAAQRSLSSWNQRI